MMAIHMLITYLIMYISYAVLVSYTELICSTV